MSPGSNVIITTGFVLHPMQLRIGETDGPPGAVVLARALLEAFGAVPIILSEESQRHPTEVEMIAVGLTPVSLQNVGVARDGGWTHTSVFLDFPLDEGEAMKRSSELISELEPSAIIAVEKPGKNKKGVHHSSKGFDISAENVKVDFLIEEAKNQNILTVGIGDGGNEIGFGLIEDAARKYVPYGAKCQCPCGAGIITSTATDNLVTAGVSNWGAYGIVACLAALLEKTEILHTGPRERNILVEGTKAGLVGTVTRKHLFQADSLDVETHEQIVELMRTTVIRSLEK